MGIARAEDFAARKSGSEKLGNVSADSGAIVERGGEESRKRKMDECEEVGGAVREWTEEQELALRRAYLVAKPTPNFWKKVSRLVKFMPFLCDINAIRIKLIVKVQKNLEIGIS